MGDVQQPPGALDGGLPRAYALDVSIHRSYYRGVSIHGTHRALISQSVAYDIIGHWCAHTWINAAPAVQPSSHLLPTHPSEVLTLCVAMSGQNTATT